MSVDALTKTARTLVDYCKTQQEHKGLEELYDPAAVSVEAMPGPDGSDPVSKGIEAIRGKHAWWNGNFEVHGGTLDGPYIHGDDRFAVIFEIDATEKASGMRWQMKEVAVYEVNGSGRIVRESFYNVPRD